MKVKKNSISSVILENTPNPVDILKDIKNLTVEDVVVLYAYAEAIVETVREPLIILDENLRIKTANKAFFEDFKVTKKETYNKLIFDLGNGQWDIPELKKLLKEILPKNSYFENFEVTHKFDDIGTRTMILNARRIVLEGHKTELVLLAIEDNTQKKIIEKHKDDFIGIASHELKTPLTSVKLFVQLLQGHHEKTQDTKSIYMLDKVAKQIDRMEHMMASFLNVYSLQNGKLDLHKEHFSTDELLKNIIETFNFTYESHTIEHIGKIKKNIFADKERISQVLINLISNAIKYSPNSNKVIITSKTSRDFITFSIQDFGMGIPKEQQGMIFDRFFRAQGKEEAKVEGLGLGLYISHEIVTEHKGKMWVDSTVGKGSTFYFKLPLKS
ncbi:MAG TPA: ATP-binding protein [Candidatus Limnocylindrales bacterium]|nr:ATP-binding protein [Candidatus Limnocylindrales bacterium]